LTSIKDATITHYYVHPDAFGRVTKTTFPSGYIETYGYDADNNLTAKTDRKNQLITYTYDQLNRLAQKTYPDSTTVNYTYDLNSRLTQVSDPPGPISLPLTTWAADGNNDQLHFPDEESHHELRIRQGVEPHGVH